MSVMNKVFRYLTDRKFRTFIKMKYGFYDRLSDEEYLKIRFRYKLDQELDLEDPKTFNEKIQWLKIHDHNPAYTEMVDKLAVKKYIAGKLGEDCVVPVLGVWDKFDEIDFSKLPDRFVLKCTHDSGGIFVCTDKASFPKEEAREKINSCMKRDFYYRTREWPYKNVPRKIFAEEYIDDGRGSDLTDYKFYCFHGEPKFCQVITDRRSVEKIDFFDMDWNLQPFTGIMLPHKPHNPNVSKPESFDEMVRAAKLLSKDIAFVRVDFYDVNGKMYFGEITFYPGSGFGYYKPEEWNDILGSYIDLQKVQIRG